MKSFSTGGFVLGSKKCYFCKTTLDKKTVQDAAPEYLCGCGFPIETHVVESILNIEREVPDTTPTTLPPPKMIESERKCPWCDTPYPQSQASLWDAGECYACGRDLTGTSEHGTFTDIYASIVEGRVVALVVGGDFDGDTIELFSTAKQNFGRAEIIDKLGHFDGVEKISSSHLKVVEDDSKGRRIVDAGSLNGTRPESTHLNTGGDIELAGVLTLRIPSAEKQGSADYPHDPNPVAIPEIPEISVPSSIPLPPSPKGKKGPPPPPDYVPPEITARVTEGPMAGKTFQIPWPAETKPETLGREDFREALGEFDGLEMISGEHLEITYESMTGVSRISIEDAGSTNGSDPERVSISTDFAPDDSHSKPSKPMEIAGAITLEFYRPWEEIDSEGPDSAEEEPRRHQYAGCGQAAGSGRLTFRIFARQDPQRCSKNQVDDGKESSVRMSQGPQQAPGLVLGVHVEVDLEGMQGLEDDPEAQEYQQQDPAEAEVAVDGLVLFCDCGPAHRDSSFYGLPR